MSLYCPLIQLAVEQKTGPETDQKAFCGPEPDRKLEACLAGSDRFYHPIFTQPVSNGWGYEHMTKKSVEKRPYISQNIV